MKGLSYIYLWLLILALVPSSINAQNNNGLLDHIEERGTKYNIQIPTAGGALLSTDIYLPITQDSLVVNFTVPLVGSQFYAELIPKGTQLILYPTLFNAAGVEVPNPNPYQLPMLLSRTPYDKAGLAASGHAIPLLGYAFVNQDTRGRFESGGVFLPLYSDSWAKAPYNAYNHLLDITPSNDSANGRFHEDGWLSYQYLLNQYKKPFDLNGDGMPDTIAPVCNGTIGMVGASAFGIPSLQLAASHKIQPALPGLKGMLTLIATVDHFNATGYHNGCFRENLVYRWMRGQIFDIQNLTTSDSSLQNNIHSAGDFGALNKEEVLEMAMNHVSAYHYPNSPMANAYPNSPQRAEMDANFAPVDASGEGQAGGSFSRFGNMQTPNYNLTGWYDIFINGQIETWRNMRQHLASPFNNQQKLVIGPWAHTTIATRNTGDLLYPENVGDVLGITVDINQISNLNGIDFSKILQIEPISFLRNTLNTNGYVRLGEPIVRIPENQNWQGGSNFQVRIPAANYDITIAQLLNFLVGQGSLDNLPIEVNIGFGAIPFNINIPGVGGVFPIQINAPIEEPKVVDFDTVANVRLYVIGPQDSLPQNTGVGNYWLHTDEFPLTDSNLIRFVPYYLHNNGVLDGNKPLVDEGLLSYTHHPDNPVQTVGGGNLFINTPDGRNSMGQLDLADSNVVNITLNRPDVLQFETAVLTDTLSIIGYPKATIYAKSVPQGTINGETDTDFFVRIVDVYPDGREFFVVEGAVNARAREYARSIYNGVEDINAPFSNIQIDQIYEYQLECLPIAYTFGRDHRMKVLISSSNYPRYQSNPNVPIEPGDFYRRPSGDSSRSYSFQGQTYTMRIADNSIAFSDSFATRIELPVLNAQQPTFVDRTESSEIELTLAPNPATTELQLRLSQTGSYQLRLFDASARLLRVENFQADTYNLPVQELAAGLYRVELIEAKTQKRFVGSFVKK